MESSKGRALRRSHVKSKSGCLTCRHKHIRCDELRPECRNCLKRGYKCDFSTGSTSTNANDNLPSHLSASAATTDPTQIAATATSTGSKSGDGDNNLIPTLWQEISALQLPNREFFPPRTHPPPSLPYDGHSTRSSQATHAPHRSPPSLSSDLSSSLQSQPDVSSHSSHPSHQPQSQSQSQSQSQPQHQPTPLQNQQPSSTLHPRQHLQQQQPCLNRTRIANPSLAEMPIEDFRMMHHAAQITEGLALSGGHRLALGTSSLPVFIDLARSHAFVKHALLGLATSHLNCLVKLTALEALGSRYRRQACRGLQAELGKFSADNADAVLAASIMLGWQALDTPTYIKFMQGTSQVLKLMPPHSPTSRLSELFSPISPLSAHRHKQIMQRDCGSSGTLSSAISQNYSKSDRSSMLIDPPFAGAYAYNLACEVTENNHVVSSTQLHTAMGSTTLPCTRTSLTMTSLITLKPAHTQISVPTTVPASTPISALTSTSVPKLTPTPPLTSTLSQNSNKSLEMTPLLTALRTLQSSLPPTTISQTELRATTLVLQNLLENFRLLCSSSSMPASKGASTSSKASKSTPSSASSLPTINLPAQFSLLYPVRTWLPLMPVSFLGVGRRDPWALVTMAYFHVAVVLIVGQLAEESLKGNEERPNKAGGTFRGEGCGGALFAGRRTEIVVRIDREIEALKLEAEREVEMEEQAERDALISGEVGGSVYEDLEKDRNEGNDENEKMDADGNMITRKVVEGDEIGEAETMIEAKKIDSKEKLKELTRIEELMRVPLMYVVEY